ncbi:MAG: CopD family protein [Proteobacteria bacterium]|nr:CopD family protein [Pseudomonadota bacterium]
MMIDSPDALSAAFRAVSFVMLLNAAGIPIFLAAFGRLVPNSLPDIAKLGWRLTIGALVFVTAHQTLEAARMAGEMSGLADPAMQKMALMSPGGAAFAFRIIGLVLLAVGLRRAAVLSLATASPAPAPESAPRASATGTPSSLPLLGTLLTITSFTLVGHTATTLHRAAAAALLILHLSVVAFWLGSLWPLYMTAAKEQPPVSAKVIDRFSLAAAWVVPTILLAGAGLMALLLPSLAALRQPYGQLLLAKITGFAVLMAMAALNKWRFGPACAKGDTAAFKRTVVVEYVLICMVLAITAAMTMFYSPEPA